eukprot:759057-Hanusia_phi.AAC.3
MAGRCLSIAEKRSKISMHLGNQEADSTNDQQPRNHPCVPVVGLLWSDSLSLQEINLNLALGFALPGSKSLIAQLPFDALLRLGDTIREEWLVDRRKEGLLTPPTSPRRHQEQREPPNCKMERRVMKLKRGHEGWLSRVQPIAEDAFAYSLRISNILSAQRNQNFSPKELRDDCCDGMVF